MFCNPLKSLEAATRVELVNGGFAICSSDFYGLSPCCIMMFFSSYYHV